MSNILDAPALKDRKDRVSEGENSEESEGNYFQPLGAIMLFIALKKGEGKQRRA
jgi:hypothetical protein